MIHPPRPGRKATRTACTLAVLLMVVSSCTSAQDDPGDRADAPNGQGAQPAIEPSPAPTASPSPLTSPEPTAPDIASPTATPQPPTADEIGLAPLGTYAVAREGAGMRRAASTATPERLEIPVYDAPFGPPRTLVDTNERSGVNLPINLTNWSNRAGALVMRVIAGGADDEWLIVQAPTRPHDRYVWVRAGDFDIGQTAMHIEIDLADSGGLTLFDDGAEVLATDIVHGRDQRPTPTHLTYIEKGIRGAAVSPAYGTAILSMASYSDALDTFDGGLPSNFLHGTNQPGLMGQRVSSGEVRVPNRVLDAIIEEITPGTPVMIFDSSDEAQNKSAVVQRQIGPAATIGFDEGADGGRDATTGVTPQLWRRCETRSPLRLLCRMGFEASDGRYPFLVAKPLAGTVNAEVGSRVITVYDEPGGARRMLVHESLNGAGFASRMPLRNPNLSGEPLILWPLEQSPDGRWIRVAAPASPQRRSVWVRASDFDFGASDYRIEIDLAGEGKLSLFERDTEVLSNAIVSGRQSRPTTVGESYVNDIIEGRRLSPAYGSYVASYPIFSEVLSSFDGSLPNQAIHGTNQPELMGRRVSSGNIRLPSEVLSLMIERDPDLRGARVIVFDSSGIGSEAAIALLQNAPWLPARTIGPTNPSLKIGNPLF